MIGYIIIIVLVVASIFATVWLGTTGHEGWATVFGIFLVGHISFLLGSTIVIASQKDEGEDFKEKRDYYQELVNYISDDMSFSFVDNAIKTAERINATIEDHKVHVDSKMWGFLYNKYIAEVEPIDIPEFEYKIKKTEEDEGN